MTGLLACPQEPYKAFRWLMLSDVCFDTKKRCAVQYNRTHDLPYTETRPLAESDDPRMQDWLNGPIPRRHATPSRYSKPWTWRSGTGPGG